MADNSNAAPRHRLTVDTPTQQIPRDMNGPDNLIPLSPQWLLPKPGDNKPEMFPGDSYMSSHHDKHINLLNASGEFKEFQSAEKKKDGVMKRGIQTLSGEFQDAESGHYERWRDEERDTNSVRRDRWREGGREKETTDARRERWGDSSFGPSGDARRAPFDRWNDSGNRENNFEQRRESKWNTRWGPDDKDSEGWREKRADSSKNDEGSRDKGVPSQANTERDGDQYFRPWRPNSSQTRHKGDSSLMPGKQGQMFGYGRGKTGNGSSLFSAGRGRVAMSSSNNAAPYLPPGYLAEKSACINEDSSAVKYSRTKLLDIYRMMDVKSYRLLLEEIVDVPHLTQIEPSEPLALAVPTSEELVILKDIDKGDVISSGSSQNKDVSVGQNPVDTITSRSVASREDAVRKGDEMAIRENALEYLPPQHAIPWQSQSLGERAQDPSDDWKGFSDGTRPKSSDVTWLRSQNIEGANKISAVPVQTTFPSHEGFQPELCRELGLNRQPSGISDREQDTSTVLGHGGFFLPSGNIASRKFQPQPSLEELLFHYRDPQGQIQGPFPGSDLVGWFEAGYFGIDLQVRAADAPPDAPFLLLGDVMPHLQMKARAPPGFGGHKPIEAVGGLITGKVVGQGNIHSTELDSSVSGQRKWHLSTNEAENRFLESLMSRGMGSSAGSFSFSEGVKGYANNISSGLSTLGGESVKDPNYILAQRMLLERQQSLSNHLSFWAGKDSAPILSKPEPVLDSPAQYNVPSMADAPHSGAHAPEHVDILSILQASADKAPSPPINGGVPAWLNFPDTQHPLNNTMPSGIGVTNNNVDMLHNQHFTPQAAYGIQLQHLQQPKQPSLPHIVPPLDHPSNFLSPENVLASFVPQDPHVMKVLQQQYLLSQFQMPTQMPIPAQLSVLDKILLMKEQQKQEHQQQQLLLQQQQMISQIRAERQLQQHPAGSTCGILQSGVNVGNTPLTSLGLQHPTEIFQVETQMQSLNFQDGHTLDFSNLPVQNPRDAGSIVNSNTPGVSTSHLLHQDTVNPNAQATTTELIQSVSCSVSASAVPLADSVSSCEAVENSAEEVLHHENAMGLCTDVVQQGIEVVGIAPCKEGESLIHLDKCQDASEQVSFLQPANELTLEGTSEQSPESLTANKLLEEREVRKSSEKKTKKQKNSRSQSALEKVKGLTKSLSSEQSKIDLEIGGTSTTKPMIQFVAKDSHSTVLIKGINAKSETDSMEHPMSEVHLLSNEHGNEMETSLSKTVEAEAALQSNMQTLAQRAWKPAPCLKAKSLLEIQQEQQQRAQLDISNVAASPTPANRPSSAQWSGVVNLDLKSNKEVFHTGIDAQVEKGISNDTDNLDSRSMKSQLHELLAEVSTELDETVAGATTTSDSTFLLFHRVDEKTHNDGAACDDDFIEAKETKKSRRKAAKAKNATAKNPATVTLADPVPSVAAEKNKGARVAQQEEESSTLPACLSLGDFVPWKGDDSNSSPPPAWSTDSSRIQKPTSLRDILKEQEKKSFSVQIPIGTTTKSPQSRNTQGSSSNRQIPGTSPSKTAPPMKSSSFLTSAKSKFEDDLFWGPLDQPKQESRQLEFPSLGTSSSWGSKGTASKNASTVTPTRLKPASRTNTLSSSPAGQPSLRAGGDSLSKYSEAMGFRDWCERELLRLTGSSDTGFLEFCLKQSAPEAEMLLRENLGSLDPHHEFIDKLVNYKELLAADVLEIAFQPHLARENRGACNNIEADITATAESGSGKLTGVDGLDGKGVATKKKGKKGKKVSSSVLGFNVVSNRIMMGEIQSVED